MLVRISLILALHLIGATIAGIMLADSDLTAGEAAFWGCWVSAGALFSVGLLFELLKDDR